MAAAKTKRLIDPLNLPKLVGISYISKRKIHGASGAVISDARVNFRSQWIDSAGFQVKDSRTAYTSQHGPPGC